MTARAKKPKAQPRLRRWSAETRAALDGLRRWAECDAANWSRAAEENGHDLFIRAHADAREEIAAGIRAVLSRRPQVLKYLDLDVWQIAAEAAAQACAARNAARSAAAPSDKTPPGEDDRAARSARGIEGGSRQACEPADPARGSRRVDGQLSEESGPASATPPAGPAAPLPKKGHDDEGEQ